MNTPLRIAPGAIAAAETHKLASDLIEGESRRHRPVRAKRITTSPASNDLEREAERQSEVRARAKVIAVREMHEGRDVAPPPRAPAVERSRDRVVAMVRAYAAGHIVKATLRLAVADLDLAEQTERLKEVAR